MEKNNKTLNVPNLRFPEFSGEWEKTQLNHYLEENKERNKKGAFTKNDVLSVSGDYGIVNQIELLGRSFAGKSVLDYHVVRNGNIVYTKSPLKEYPYGIVKVNEGTDGIVSTLYAVYTVKENANGKFIENYFGLPSRTNKYFKPIVRIGAKHDMKIGSDEVLANYVIFPRIAEQNRISEFISLLDKRIEIQRKVSEDLKKLKDAISKSLLSRSDLLEKNIPLSQVGTLKNGYAFQSSSYDSSSEYEIVTIANVTGERYIRTEGCNRIHTIPSDLQPHQELKEDDILVSLTGNVGRVSLCNEGRYLLNQRVGLLELQVGINREFVYQAISTRKFEQSMSSCGQGAAQMNIGKGDVEGFVIPYSDNPQNLQRISLILKSYDDLILLESRRLQLLRSQKQYFIKIMFI